MADVVRSSKEKHNDPIEKACQMFLDELNYQYMKLHMIKSKRRDTVIRKKAMLKKIEDLKEAVPHIREKLLKETPSDNRP